MDKNTDVEIVLNKQRKLDSTDQVKNHMNQFFHETKDVPGMNTFIQDAAHEFVSLFSTPTVRKIDWSCLTPETNRSFQLEYRSNLENGTLRQNPCKNIKNTSNSYHKLHAEYEQAKLQQSSFLFPREEIKPISSFLGLAEKTKQVSCSSMNNSKSDGAAAKEKNIVSLQDLYRYSPFCFPSTEKNKPPRKKSIPNAKSILATSKKSNISKISEPSQKLYYTANFATQLQEREQYKLLLEQISQGQLFYSNALPAKKNLFEWTHTQISSSESDSIEKENAIFNDSKESLILKIKPKQKQELSPRLLKYKPFSSEWLEAMKETIDRQAEESQKFIADKERQVKAYEEKKAARHAELLKKLQARSSFTLSSDALETVGLEKQLVLPELTAEMNDVIDNAVLPRSPSTIIYHSTKYTVLQKDIDTLVGSNWLNDEVMNTYMMFITERSKLPNYPSVFAFSSFFYPRIKSSGHTAVKRWTRKDDIFSYDLNIIPMHLGVHWCLGVFDHRCKKIQYYDSMNTNEKCLTIFKAYLMAESLDKKKKELDPEWTVEQVKNIPPQLNGSDCGVFTLKYAEYIARNAKINFTQEHMPYFRRKMIYELITGSIN